MPTRRAALAFSALAFAGFAASPALAADKAPFTRVAFDAALKAGRPVLVEVTAPWCSVCKAQKPIISELTGDPKFARLAIFEVDFDSQKDALRALNVQRQSTLIIYKGGREAGRSTGETARPALASLIGQAI